jgi:carbonic anhydrase
MCKLCESSLPNLSRRSMMAGAAALLTASALPHGARAEEKAASSAQNTIPPAQALERLMQGNARYAANTPNERDFSAERAARAEAQFPVAAIVSCSDSRVVPELVFDQSPGDLFVVRLAGNIVDDDAYASLEYAVMVLNAPLVFIMGHSGCGAVEAAIKVVKDRVELPGHLPGLIAAIEPAVIAAHARHPSDLLAAAIEENVLHGMKEMRKDSKIIAEAFDAKRIGIAGGVYDIATGKVNLLQS